MNKPWMAGVFSAVIPGLGQFVLGRRERGLALLAGWLVIPALYGLIMVGVEQLAFNKSLGADELINLLGRRALLSGYVDLATLSYAFICLTAYWLLNIFDAVQCAKESA